MIYKNQIQLIGLLQTYSEKYADTAKISHYLLHATVMFRYQWGFPAIFNFLPVHVDPEKSHRSKVSQQDPLADLHMNRASSCAPISRRARTLRTACAATAVVPVAPLLCILRKERAVHGYPCCFPARRLVWQDNPLALPLVDGQAHI